ncbi:SCO family protein [Kineobactrum salinum]|uniref:SCO family protein n=1 Tax=Kineobactrum salinum TaxID=2708301 RepID=A0A6C0U853_9GAMM|nr:SCO family protein [Kineobactrum salinum]QIB65674.1 SCO family protein [Kineobactrum salinum]
MSANHTRAQSRGIRITVVGVLLFILLVIAAFVHRTGQPRVMPAAEMQANGAYLLETPRDIGDFELIDHHGEPFTPARLEGHWTLLFFGFTFCPDICPTTMSFLNQFVEALEGTEARDTQVAMISVDPARDTVAQLAGYVPFFNEDFIGVTGEFLDIHRFATALNTPFRKVPGQDENYLVDHSANVVLINPRGDYHGFFKAPLDLAKMKVTYRSIRVLWDR